MRANYHLLYQNAAQRKCKIPVDINQCPIQASLSNQLFIYVHKNLARIYYDEECILIKPSNSEKVFLDNLFSSTNPSSGWYM
jgi:hypothetical protein